MDDEAQSLESAESGPSYTSRTELLHQLTVEVLLLQWSEQHEDINCSVCRGSDSNLTCQLHELLQSAAWSVKFSQTCEAHFGSISGLPPGFWCNAARATRREPHEAPSSEGQICARYACYEHSYSK